MITIITTHSFDNLKEDESKRRKKLLSRIWIMYLASRLRFMDENFHLNFFIYISNISYMINFPLTFFASRRCCSTTSTTSDEFNYFSLVFLSHGWWPVTQARFPAHIYLPSQLLITRLKAKPCSAILRPSKCRCEQKQANIPKNRKNTYQHILIKNLESPSPVCSCAAHLSVGFWRMMRKKSGEKNQCTCSHGK